MNTEKSQKVMNERGRHKILPATTCSITAWSWTLRGRANLGLRIRNDAGVVGPSKQTKGRWSEDI